MKILVTGGKGFLGSAISRKLIEYGHQVETLSRTNPTTKELGIKHHKLDLSKKIIDVKLFKDVECVFHVAAKAGVDGYFNDYYMANFVGTKNLLEISKTMGVRYFIYTSSPSVVFSGKPIQGGVEKMPYVSNRISSYSLTKAMAEKKVLSSNINKFFTAIALRPHLIWGEGDPHLLPKVISRHKRKKLKIVGDGQNQVDLTHIENVVHAHILAFEALISGKALGGKAYFISQNEPVRLWRWLNSIFEVLDLGPLENKISFRKAFAVGATLEVLWKFLRLKAELPMTRFVACQLSHDHWFSTQAAKSDFGYEPIISMEEALEKTIPWLRNL